MDGFRSERQNPKINAAADRIPADLLKDGGDVISGRGSGDGEMTQAAECGTS